MDLSAYTLEDLIAIVIKSECEEKDVYEVLAGKVSNVFLRDRLLFLAGEEEKHRVFLKTLWDEMFQGADLILPQKSCVPRPIIEDEKDLPMNDILSNAMEAEKSNSEFYEEMARKAKNKETKSMLSYLSRMEMEHYRILKEERDNLDIFKNYEPM